MTCINAFNLRVFKLQYFVLELSWATLSDAFAHSLLFIKHVVPTGLWKNFTGLTQFLVTSVQTNGLAATSYPESVLSYTCNIKLSFQV